MISYDQPKTLWGGLSSRIIAELVAGIHCSETFLWLRWPFIVCNLGIESSCQCYYFQKIPQRLKDSRLVVTDSGELSTKCILFVQLALSGGAIIGGTCGLVAGTSVGAGTGFVGG
eukprot:3077472-Amphidinium_carterae.1